MEKDKLAETLLNICNWAAGITGSASNHFAAAQIITYAETISKALCADEAVRPDTEDG
jgi:hypothetical protein